MPKKTIIFALFALLFIGLFCVVNSVLRPSGYPLAQGTTSITIFNNTDTSYCRVWFGEPTIGLETYILQGMNLGRSNGWAQKRAFALQIGILITGPITSGYRNVAPLFWIHI